MQSESVFFQFLEFRCQITFQYLICCSFQPQQNYPKILFKKLPLDFDVVNIEKWQLVIDEVVMLFQVTIMWSVSVFYCCCQSTLYLQRPVFNIESCQYLKFFCSFTVGYFYVCMDVLSIKSYLWVNIFICVFIQNILHMLCYVRLTANGMLLVDNLILLDCFVCVKEVIWFIMSYWKDLSILARTWTAIFHFGNENAVYFVIAGTGQLF